MNSPTKYPVIADVLSTIDSIDTGVEQEMAKQMLRRTLNEMFRSRIEPELNAAFVDESVSWREMLWNDDYEVCLTDSEDEANGVAVELLWDVVFPDSPLSAT